MLLVSSSVLLGLLSLPLPLSLLILCMSDSPNWLTWLRGDNHEEEEEEEDDVLNAKNVFKSIAPTMQLPLVVDYYKLNQNTIGASVSHLVT